MIQRPPLAGCHLVLPHWRTLVYTYYEMARGPYQGRDPRAVADEAIAWWEQYLDGIDARAAELPSP